MGAHISHPPGAHGAPGGYHEGDDWHHRLNERLHGVQFHRFLNVLLIVDIIFVVVGTTLEISYLEGKAEDLEHAFLEVCDGHQAGVCPSSAVVDDHDFVEGEFGDLRLEDARGSLAVASLAILFLFAAELSLLVLANGRRFFTNVFYVLDLGVVVASIIIELAEHHHLQGGLLVAARMWRFVRIGHGIYELDHEANKNGEQIEGEHETDELDGGSGRELATRALAAQT